MTNRPQTFIEQLPALYNDNASKEAYERWLAEPTHNTERCDLGLVQCEGGYFVAKRRGEHLVLHSVLATPLSFDEMSRHVRDHRNATGDVVYLVRWEDKQAEPPKASAGRDVASRDQTPDNVWGARQLRDLDRRVQRVGERLHVVEKKLREPITGWEDRHESLAGAVNVLVKQDLAVKVEAARLRLEALEELGLDGLVDRVTLAEAYLRDAGPTPAMRTRLDRLEACCPGGTIEARIAWLEQHPFLKDNTALLGKLLEDVAKVTSEVEHLGRIVHPVRRPATKPRAPRLVSEPKKAAAMKRGRDWVKATEGKRSAKKRAK